MKLNTVSAISENLFDVVDSFLVQDINFVPNAASFNGFILNV